MMGFFRKKSKSESQNLQSSSSTSDRVRNLKAAINSHPDDSKETTFANKISSSSPLHGDNETQSKVSSNAASPYSESAPTDKLTPKENSPFPILEQLVTLVQDLKEFVELHLDGIKALEDRIVTYEREKPLLDINILISFTETTIAPFYKKFGAIFTDHLYGFNPSSAEIKKIDSCFKPLLGKVSQLREEIRWHIDPHKRATLRELMNHKTRHVFMTYQQYASQSSTHIQKHLEELAMWLESKDFKESVTLRPVHPSQ